MANTLVTVLQGFAACQIGDHNVNDCLALISLGKRDTRQSGTIRSRICRIGQDKFIAVVTASGIPNLQLTPGKHIVSYRLFLTIIFKVFN